MFAIILPLSYDLGNLKICTCIYKYILLYNRSTREYGGGSLDNDLAGADLCRCHVDKLLGR